MVTKSEALKLAVEIARDAAKGGNAAPWAVLENTFKKILELLPQANAPITE